MVANYTEIIAGQTDRNSPISENLMETLRKNQAAINTAVDDLSSGALADATSRPLAVEVRGLLADIPDDDPVDFPNPLREGRLQSAKVLFQNLSEIRGKFSNAVRILRRRNVSIRSDSVTPVARFTNINIAKSINEQRTNSFTHSESDYTWSENELFEDGQPAQWVSHDGEYGTMRFSASATPNYNVWVEGLIFKVEDSDQNEVVANAEILSVDRLSRMVSFKLTASTTAYSGSGLEAKAANAKILTLNGAPGAEYVRGELCNTGRILDKNIGGNNIVVREFVLGVLTRSTGTLRTGRAEFTFDATVAAEADLPSFFPSGSIAAIDATTGGIPIPPNFCEVISVTGGTVKVRNLADSDGSSQSAVTVTATHFSVNVGDSSLLNVGDFLIMNNGAFRPEVVSKPDGQTVFLKSSTSVGSSSVGYSSRFRVDTDADLSGTIKVGGRISLRTFDGKSVDYLEVADVNTQSGTNIVVQIGDKEKSDTDSMEVGLAVNAYYEGLTQVVSIEDSSVTRINESVLVDISSQLLPVANTPGWTLSVLFSRLVPK